MLLDEMQNTLIKHGYGRVPMERLESLVNQYLMEVDNNPGEDISTEFFLEHIVYMI